MPRIPVQELAALYRGLAAAVGAPASEAETFAECLISADLRGVTTQGSGFVKYVLSSIRRGDTQFGAPWTLLVETPAMAVADAGGGVGSVVASRAMALAVEKAQGMGVGCVWVRNGGELGMAAAHAIQALSADCVGVAMLTSDPPRVAPWGGRDAVFGTDPIAVAIPRGSEPPIVVDMAAGSVSVGSVVMAARDGRRLDGLHLVDEDGVLSDDPRRTVANPEDRESLFTGALVPLGHKGYSWLLLVETIAGILSGMGPSGEHSNREGMFFMAIHVPSVLPVEMYTSSIARLADNLRSSRPVQGFAEVLIPGDIERHNEEQNREKGVSVREDDWADLQRLASELSVDM